MIKMKNKKGFALTLGMVVAIFVAIVFLIFLLGGGLSTIYDITKNVII